MLWDDGSGKREEADEKLVPVAGRLPESMKAHLVALRGEGHGAITDALKDVIRLHRGLFERLKKERIRLQKYASDEGLAWPGQAPEVFARLIRKGLDAAEK